MLSFLDAGVNVKGAPNENFAREIMELFTMGVGNYTEKDIREGRARVHRLELRRSEIRRQQRSARRRREDVSGQHRPFRRRGGDRHHHAAAGHRRLHRRQDLSLLRPPGTVARRLQKKLGAVLRDNHYEIAPLLETIFLSRDFYSPASVGTQIKSPVELAVSHLQEARPERSSRRSGFQHRHRRAGAAACSRRRPWRDGPEARVGSLPACCSSAAISPATCCFPTSTSFRRIA